MNEKNSDTPVPAKLKLNVVLLNCAGIVLIIVAAFFYWNDIKSNKAQVNAANVVRMCASNPIMAMGLMLDSEGSASNAYMICSVDIATNILANLVKAEPTDFPRSRVDGDTYEIFMMYTNRTSVVMQAARLYKDPSNLYVRVRQPARLDADNKPIDLSYTPPALVIGLGTLFNTLAETNIPLLRARVAKMPPIEAAMTNQYGTVNQRPEESTPIDAASVSEWMNSTNTPAAD